MAEREIVLVVARARNGVIGKDGKLPWHIPADLKHFKRVTSGAPMVMGRRTFDSLPGLLPGRRHIVLTRDTSWQAEGAEVAHTPEAALALANVDRVSIIGGAEIFALYEPLATAVEFTEVELDAEGDTLMPSFDPARWREVCREEHPAVDAQPPFTFLRLVRATS